MTDDGRALITLLAKVYTAGNEEQRKQMRDFLEDPSTYREVHKLIMPPGKRIHDPSFHNLSVIEKSLLYRLVLELHTKWASRLRQGWDWTETKKFLMDCLNQAIHDLPRWESHPDYTRIVIEAAQKKAKDKENLDNSSHNLFVFLKRKVGSGKKAALLLGGLFKEIATISLITPTSVLYGTIVDKLSLGLEGLEEEDLLKIQPDLQIIAGIEVENRYWYFEEAARYSEEVSYVIGAVEESEHRAAAEAAKRRAAPSTPARPATAGPATPPPSDPARSAEHERCVKLRKELVQQFEYVKTKLNHMRNFPVKLAGKIPKDADQSLFTSLELGKQLCNQTIEKFQQPYESIRKKIAEANNLTKLMDVKVDIDDLTRKTNEEFKLRFDNFSTVNDMIQKRKQALGLFPNIILKNLIGVRGLVSCAKAHIGEISSKLKGLDKSKLPDSPVVPNLEKEIFEICELLKRLEEENQTFYSDGIVRADESGNPVASDKLSTETDSKKLEAFEIRTANLYVNLYNLLGGVRNVATKANQLEDGASRTFLPLLIAAMEAFRPYVATTSHTVPIRTSGVSVRP